MAIARNGSATLGRQNPANPYSASYTCSAGADRILFVSFWTNNATDVVTSVTYNGVGMTSMVTPFGASADGLLYCYALAAPATGANNVVINVSSGILIDCFAVDYTGASASGIPDSTNTNTNGSAGSVTCTQTIVASNCWVVSQHRENAGNADTPTGLTELQEPLATGHHLADSNGTVSTGSQSFTQTVSGASRGAMLTVAFAPVGAGGGGIAQASSLTMVGMQ